MIAVRVAHALAAAVFVLCIAVQFNDPDPIRWIAMYGAALIVACLGVANRANPVLAALVALVALSWALTQADSFVTCLTTKSACFTSWDMHDDLVAEEAREV